ncbi:hypothetical protein [Rhodococcus sp. ARC_M6]|uniref:hypothetical protein n=1 Tax=Rhodococcus sp. ARC_M6 TaxID=2928852 RepID=UPI001FB231F3|nr:hypothetical protein [Rhodococcus sp. ARC_M6]MCJ0904454.1 hypothetical protein [Rhodococcus sp. ARC_M6]
MGLALVTLLTAGGMVAGRPGDAEAVVPTIFGLPAETPLRVHNGDLTIRTPGTVIENLDIRGFVRVEASNVTIRRSIVRGRDPQRTNQALVAAYGDHRNFRIEDTTLKPSSPSPYVDGIKGRNFSARRVDISKVVDSVVIFGDNVDFGYSWLHDNLHYSPWPQQWDNQTHDDNVQIEGGRNISVHNSRLDGAHNAAVMITQNYARGVNIQINDNIISGGQCGINVDEKGRGPIGLSIKNNRFGKTGIPDCGILAPKTSVGDWTMNSWVATGNSVRVRNPRKKK